MTIDPTRSDTATDTELGSPVSSTSPTTGCTAGCIAGLAARLDAVERTITDGDADFSSLEDLVAIERQVTKLESVVESLTDRLDEMDAAMQAMCGYPGGVHAVSENVEHRVNAVLAKAELLESELVDKTASPASLRSTDMPASEVASYAGRTTDGGDGGDSQRAAGTGSGTGTAVFSSKSRTAPDPSAPTGSHSDPADRGLTTRLRGAL